MSDRLIAKWNEADRRRACATGYSNRETATRT